MPELRRITKDVGRSDFDVFDHTHEWDAFHAPEAGETILSRLEKIVERLKRKRRQGSHLTEDQLFYFLLYHCFDEESYPGTRTDIKLRPLPPAGDPDTIGLVQLSRLGDVYATLPLIRCLRDRFEPEKLIFFTDPPYTGALEGLSEIDEVIGLPTDAWMEPVREGRLPLDRIRAWIHRQPRIDLGLNCHDSMRSAVLLRLLQPGRIWGMQYKTGEGPLVSGTAFTHWKVLFPYVLETGEHNPHRGFEHHPVPQQLLLRFGMDSKRGFRFPTSPFRGGNELESSRTNVGIILAGGWRTKRWVKSHWKKMLARAASTEDWGFHLIGGSDVRKLGESLAGKDGRVRDWTGETELSETAALLSQMDAVVSNDTGPLHLAGWVGTPALTLTGPTKIGSSGPAPGIILQRDLECIGCQSPDCRIEPERLCMFDLSPELVLRHLRWMVEANHRNWKHTLPPVPGSVNRYVRPGGEPYRYHRFPDRVTDDERLEAEVLGWVCTALLSRLNEVFHPPSGRLLRRGWLTDRMEERRGEPNRMKKVVKRLQSNMEGLRERFHDADPGRVDWRDHPPLGTVLSGLAMLGSGRRRSGNRAVRQYQERALELFETWFSPRDKA